jgi:hypothetical protein
MESDFNLEDRETFRINPETWLHTLLAIAGDQEKKEEVLQIIAKKTGYLPEQVEVIFATTISLLINQTRTN